MDKSTLKKRKWETRLVTQNNISVSNNSPDTSIDSRKEPGRFSAPKVSVLLITYNHERYIAQAIESVLMQETTFPVVINVIEDCSTDRTASIVLEYAARYPGRVVPYLNKKNIGRKVTQLNFTRGFKTLDGSYWALLEGDDYWTDRHKLQRQVDFLDNNPDYVICAHNTIKVYEDGSAPSSRFLYYGKKDDGGIYEAVTLRMFFHTTGVIYRNVFNGVPPYGYNSRWSCDIYIFITHAAHGKIHHIDEDMAVYRAHSGGLFSTMKELNMWKYNIGGLQRYNIWMRFRYLGYFSESIIKFCDHILSESGKNGVAALTGVSRLKYKFIRSIYIACLAVLNIPNAFRRSLLSRILSGSKQNFDGVNKINPALPAHYPASLWLYRAIRFRHLARLSDSQRSAMPQVSSALLTGLERILRMEVSPDPLPNIISVSPLPFIQGKAFNVQPNGKSAMWVQVNAPVPHHSVLILGGCTLRTEVEHCVLTAIVPLKLLDQVGLVPIWIEATSGKEIRMSDPFFVDIQPRQALAPIRLPSIEILGPQPVNAGEAFNEQPDGSSAIWARLDGPTPEGTRIRFGDTLLRAEINGSLLTATVPAELTTQAGIISVQLECEQDGHLAHSASVDFEVRPRQALAPITLPSIEILGPQPVNAGEAFNEQADGSSAIWARLDGPAPEGTRIRFGDTLLRSEINGSLLTATVPAELTTQVGIISVQLECEQDGHLTHSACIDFEVRPRQKN